MTGTAVAVTEISHYNISCTKSLVSGVLWAVSSKKIGKRVSANKLYLDLNTIQWWTGSSGKGASRAWQNLQQGHKEYSKQRMGNFKIDNLKSFFGKFI